MGIDLDHGSFRECIIGGDLFVMFAYQDVGLSLRNFERKEIAISRLAHHQSK